MPTRPWRPSSRNVSASWSARSAGATGLPTSSSATLSTKARSGASVAGVYPNT
jgi:hypothetical protein